MKEKEKTAEIMRIKCLKRAEVVRQTGAKVDLSDMREDFNICLTPIEKPSSFSSRSWKDSANCVFYLHFLQIPTCWFFGESQDVIG